MPVIECVPNVSEGRQPDVINRLARTFDLSGLHVLDVSSDADHNRSVLTVAGTAAGLKAGVLALLDAAIGAIDLRQHRGVHPRLGAVDVVPFVPIEGVTMAECVALARETAAAAASEFKLPIYLYEEAAINPARRTLADIRRGEFEGLTAKMAMPGWAPDFGPDMPHPTAGATVIGARRPLIAYNINLDTDQLLLAKRIAVTVRESSGGLAFVKAMGVPLADRGIVQVSMNLTNYERTPIERVFDAVAAEARKLGVSLLESEIVGLIPAAAMAGTNAAHLKLRGFSRSQILEERLRSTMAPGRS